MPTYGPGWGRSRAGAQRNLRGETRNYHRAPSNPALHSRGKAHWAGGERFGEGWRCPQCPCASSKPSPCHAQHTAPFPRAETAPKQPLPPLEMMLPRKTPPDQPPEGTRLQHPPWLSVKGAGVDLGWVFWDKCSRCFHHTRWGKNGPRCKEGEQLLLFWLSHGEKNPAPFQQLGHVLKMMLVTRRDGIKVGGRPLAVWAQQHLLKLRKTE